ncbi:MAG: translocation/assembly module TamB [Ignavibacteria bacterium]|nr:translocation/assembly module TamB [Ignavibacteria bacterium]
MESNEVEIKGKNNSNKKSFLWKIPIIIVLVFLAGSLLITLIFTFNFSKTYLLKTALNIVNEEFNGKISFEKVHFNLFKGIIIDNVLFSLNSDTILFATKVRIDWDFSPIFKNKLIIKYVELEKPYINLIKGKGEDLWNIERFFKPSKKEKAKSKTNLVVFINNFKITQGSVRIKNENHINTENTFQPENLLVQNLSISLKGKIDLFQNKFDFDFKHLSLYEMNYGIEIDKLSTFVGIDTNNIQAEKILLKTPKTNLSIDFYYDFKSHNVSFNIEPSNVNTSDILKFAKLPLAENKEIKISGKIEIGRAISINDVTLQFPGNSKLNITGKVDPTHYSPFLDLTLNNVKLYEREIRPLFPNILNSIPIEFTYFYSQNYKVKYANRTIFLEGSFVSHPGNFASKLVIDSNFYLQFDINFRKLNLNHIQHKLPVTELDGNTYGKLLLTSIRKLNGNLVLNIIKGNSELDGFKDFQLSTCSRIENGIIQIDSLDFSYLVGDTTNFTRDNKLKLKGTLNFSNPANPEYTGNIVLNNLPLKKFFSNNNNVPENISGKFYFEGKGINLDSLELNFFGNFYEFSFSDRALFPFKINLTINFGNPLNKEIAISSDILNCRVNGNYQISTLAENLVTQFTIIEKTILNKIDSVLGSDSSSNVTSTLENTLQSSKKNSPHSKKANFEADFEIKDFSLLSIFLNTNLIFSGDLKIRAEIDETKSNLVLDSLNIKYFSYERGKDKISLSNLFANARCYSKSLDSFPTLDFFTLKTSTENRIVFGNTYFDYIDAELIYKNEELIFDLQTSVNSIFATKIKGISKISQNQIISNFEKLDLSFQNIFQWRLEYPFVLFANAQSINIDKLELVRENAETINIKGSYYFNDTLDFKCSIFDIPLYDFQKLLPEGNSLSKIKTFSGKVNKIEFELRNTLANPKINLELLSSGLQFESVELGNIFAQVLYFDNNIEGNVTLKNRTDAPLEIKLIEIPFEINLEEMKFGLIKNKEFKAFVDCEKLNIAPLSLFTQNSLEELKGNAKISTSVSGFLPEDLRFNGHISLLDASFIPKANNLKYFLAGNIDLNGTEFLLNELKISNTKEDFRNGNGLIFGKIIFANNRLENIDLTLSSSGLKVLSQASSKSLPQIYGDLVISTTPDFLRFYYTRNDMSLSGTLNFLSGKLYMPETTTNSTVQESFVQYEISGSKSKDTNEEQKDENIQSQPSNLKLDLTLRFVQPVELTLDIASIGQIYAVISLEDNFSNLRFYSDPKNNISLLTGNDLVLREGSTLKFIKLLNTEGKINFPTGSIDNPGLNLKAYYSGQSVYNDAIRNFTVTIHITGTREKPNLRFDYTIDGQPASDDSSKVAQDAIFLLAFGRTKSEVEKGGLSENFNFSEFSTSGSSALLSKLVSDALSSTGFISSADIILPPTASSLDRATLKVSGRFLGMTWNFGGTMADLINNNELSVEIPIGTVLPFSFPNIILQLSRTSSLTQSIQRNQKDWEIKLKYGSIW